VTSAILVRSVYYNTLVFW